MDKIVLNDFAREKIKPRQIVGFIIKLIIVGIIYISCFCVVYGIGTSNSFSFSQYTHLQQFLICITIMLIFLPLVYLSYKFKRLKNNRLNQVLIGFIFLYSAILFVIFALMAFD